jgi:alanine racemase
MALPNNPPYPTWLEINLSAVEDNVHTILKSTGVPLMTVVKGNAYGHGAVDVGKAALGAGATWLAVARVNEARILRQAGIRAPILVLGMVPAMEVDEAIQSDLTLPLTAFEAAEIFSQRAHALGKPLKVHLKVDTGLGRLGVLPDEALPLAQRALQLGGLELDGMFSHFAFADRDNHPMMRTQVERFRRALDSLHAEGIKPTWVHHANSGAVMGYPDARFNMVRAAQAVLGLNPFSYTSRPEVLRPALTAWKTRLVSCKVLPGGWGVGYGNEYVTPGEEVVGVASVGFGDGIRRLPGNELLIGGQRVPVIGATCMDQVMMRLPGKFPLDTEVVVVGRQGSEEITLEQFAARYNTVHVDVTTMVTARVQRVYYRD